MHLVFFARGVQHQIDIWKTIMQCQFFTFPRKDMKTNETVLMLVQGALRPTLFGAWEYVFPKEALPEVLSMMGITDVIYSKNFKKVIGLKILRKMLDCKPIPKKAFEEAGKLPNILTINGRSRGIYHCEVKGVLIHVVGIKDDETGIMQTDIDKKTGEEIFYKEGFEQELL